MVKNRMRSKKVEKLEQKAVPRMRESENQTLGAKA